MKNKNNFNNQSSEKLELFHKLSQKGFSLIKLRGKDAYEKGWPKWCKEQRKFDEIGFQPEFIKDCTNQLCVFLSIPSISIKEK